MPEVADSPTIPVARLTEPADLRLLIDPAPWFQTFKQNLQDLFRPAPLPPLHLQSAPGTFWPDVFVNRKLPWRRFSESGGYHLLAIILIVAASRFFALQPHAVSKSAFNHTDVVYYSASEYLPPLNTLRSKTATPHAGHAQKADPGFSPQPVISVPRESDNHSQTIVAAPRIPIQHDVPLPNTVAWSDTPRMPIAPAPLVPASQISRLAPQLENSIVAPPPTVDRSQRQAMLAPQPNVVAPPPTFEAASNRHLGDMNIGRSAIIAPAPQLSLSEQRTMPQTRAAVHGNTPRVVAPPPSLRASGGSRSGAAIVALSLNPAVSAPPRPAAGNRRGTFASTPNGRPGASGAPADSDKNAGAPGKNRNTSLPSGLYVGGNSSSNTVNPNLIAGARMPHAASSAESANDANITEAERQVFGTRKIYSLSLNMPNLNSGGGSWIIRFAPLTQDPAHTQDVSSPVATSKVDPAYPLELMRQNVQGTVILYAIIHADGTVGAIRVLRSVDDRLDRFASQAIAKWKFQPAMKAGSPVDVEATFWIPFRPAKTHSDF
jgi:TonB family protein